MAGQEFNSFQWGECLLPSAEPSALATEQDYEALPADGVMMDLEPMEAFQNSASCMLSGAESNLPPDEEAFQITLSAPSIINDVVFDNLMWKKEEVLSHELAAQDQPTPIESTMEAELEQIFSELPNLFQVSSAGALLEHYSADHQLQHYSTVGGENWDLCDAPFGDPTLEPVVAVLEASPLPDPGISCRTRAGTAAMAATTAAMAATTAAMAATTAALSPPSSPPASPQQKAPKPTRRGRRTSGKKPAFRECDLTNTCEDCGFRAKSRELLRRHGAKHRPAKHRCEEPGCDFKTRYRTNFTRHLKKHIDLADDNDPRVKQCDHPGCGVRKTRQDKMDTHVRTAHKNFLTCGENIYRNKVRACKFVCCTRETMVDHQTVVHRPRET